MRMSLVHYVRPFLELGICKEYYMARKTTGSTTTNRSKKTGTQPAAVQVASEIPKEVRKNGKSADGVPVNVPVNLEEEIRRRAYELYLERRATAGCESGDENQDWLVAEREIRSRQGGQEQHTA
jgi:hypothetical protein